LYAVAKVKTRRMIAGRPPRILLVFLTQSPNCLSRRARCTRKCNINSKSLEKPPAVLPASASASRANFLRWQVQLWNWTTRQCTQGSEYHARDKVHLRNSILDFPYSSEIGPTNDAWVNRGARNPRQNSESTGSKGQHF
jgi:hypothetical protein